MSKHRSCSSFEGRLRIGAGVGVEGRVPRHAGPALD
jgi:hypothetical protein